MRTTLLTGLLFALTAGALAQTPQALLETSPAQAAAVSSNGPVVFDYGQGAFPNDDEGRIAKRVRHELLLLPYYSLFDDLEYSVQGRTVTLNGYVTSIHSITKSSAEGVVKRIEGVDKVVNNIKVLPPAPFDQEARARVYRSLVRTGGLSRYFWEASPAIHIIVENQRVTLKGFVNTEGDKNLATIAANEVPDVFQVTNDLRVVK
jgi:hyperosmotically inducible periplasmic protein